MNHDSWSIKKRAIQGVFVCFLFAFERWRARTMALVFLFLVVFYLRLVDGLKKIFVGQRSEKRKLK